MEPIAHTRNANGERQGLVAHLRGVADLARGFAGPLGAPGAAWYLGLVHDVGKLDPEFQAYLARCEQQPGWRGHGPDHKAAGSDHALRTVNLGALAVQGHHGGLASPAQFRAWLAEAVTRPAVLEAERQGLALMPELASAVRPALPPHVQTDPIGAELFLRLLYSALVDADFLDTERHFDAGSSHRRGVPHDLAELWRRFEHHHARFPPPERGDEVARARSAVYAACLAAADAPPGIFRLTVPTGGGKTLSGLAFALRHALRNGQRRVIVAVPFLTITEQTADSYREALEVSADAGRVVLEHHSEAGWSRDDDAFDQATVWGRLASENWDAPIIVTTTVQLFESLFAHRPGRCRKLHRLAGSVLILDEAQALPPHLLTPVLDVLRDLVAHYRVSVVLCTATQPAFEAIDPFASVMASEIVPDAPRLFHALRRVRYEWRTDAPVPWEGVASEMRAARQALAVVNTKRDAMALLDVLGVPEALHLSTSLCGAHRRAVIREMRGRLQDGRPCLVVSTQVVEAGVDVDFPFVLRALGPLDGIIQAAGRCNREGNLREGRVLVFEPMNGGLPGGSYRAGTGQTRVLLGSGALAPDDPATTSAYFRALYALLDTDRERIQPLRRSLDYPEVSRAFRMVDESDSIVVSYGTPEERRRVEDLTAGIAKGAGGARMLFRALQPYVVAIHPPLAERYGRDGLASPIAPGLWRWNGRYDAVRGLVPDGIALDELVV